MNLPQIFVNHYQTKLTVYPPNFDIYLAAIFILLSFCTLKKALNDQPLSRSQTNQMKGIAIILILFNHVCYYTDPPPSLYAIWSEAGMIGVAIFFILSGYGLCVSLQKKGIKDFFTKRITRIFIPLVYSMLLLLSFYIIFVPNQHKNIFLELPRILFMMESLDGKLWFIIFILFWYCLLYLTYRLNFSNKQRLFFLFTISLLIITIPDFIYVAKGNALSFPFGCLIGLNSYFFKDKINGFLRQDIKTTALVLIGLSFFSGVLFFGSKTMKSNVYQSTLTFILILVLVSTLCLLYLYFIKKMKQTILLENIFFVMIVSIVYFNYLSHVFKTGVDEPLSMIYWSFFRSSANILIASTIIMITTLMVRFKYYSLFLSFLGTIAFEIFLLHNTFLIHFDFFLFRKPIIITFLIYFLMTCVLSLILKKLSDITLKIALKQLSIPS